jgi:N-acetylglucosamine-6-phosphate deacetylase
MGTMIISNVKLVLPGRIVPGNVLVENGIIAAVDETAGKLAFPPDWKNENTELIDGGGHYLSPGFIDIHNHGRLGCDVLDGSAASMKTIACGQAEHGVTGFLAGTSSIPWEKSLEAIRFLAGYCKSEDAKERSQDKAKPAEDDCEGDEIAEGARCLGIYSEGCFFSMEKRGAHNPSCLKTALNEKDLDALLEASGAALKVVALSPELPGSTVWIRRLADKGIVVAAAHSNASYKEAMAGIDAGITLATHAFNGMRSLSHQEPGILGAVLDDDRVFCELISDGIHLNPVIISLACKLKGQDKIILISDSVIANGLPDGCYEREGFTVIIKDGVVRLEDGRLAGSTLSLDKAVRNMVCFAGTSLCNAVRAASLNPAKILGLEKSKGSIAPGKDADLILFDETVTVKKVFIHGRLFSHK